MVSVFLTIFFVVIFICFGIKSDVSVCSSTVSGITSFIQNSLFLEIKEILFLGILFMLISWLFIFLNTKSFFVPLIFNEFKLFFISNFESNALGLFILFIISSNCFLNKSIWFSLSLIDCNKFSFSFFKFLFLPIFNSFSCQTYI